MATNPNDQLATMIANLAEKTGKSLEQWKPVIDAQTLDKHGLIVRYLKSEHAVTHGFANLIASKYLASDEAVNLVDAQYVGGKEHLREIYEAILKFATQLGSDVEVAPKKTSVSLRRNKQFALIVPATKKRVDLGLALKGEAPNGRLESYNSMCSHKIKIESIEQFDQEVKEWVSEAYSRC